MSYDLQCLMLAEYFYPDWPAEAQEALAELVQDLIESEEDLLDQMARKQRDA